MAARFFIVAALAALVVGYKDTSPVVAWSSHHSNLLDGLVPSANPVVQDILYSKDICEHDAVVLVEHPGLHASDLRALSPHSHLARSLSSSPSARQFPYVPHGSAEEDQTISFFAAQVASKCGAHLLDFTAGQGGLSPQHDSKHVVSLNMPALEYSGQDRKTAMVEHDSLLATELAALAALFPHHLIIYTGAPLPFSKRQAPDLAPPARPVLDLSPGHAPSAAANSTLPAGGILKRYQLLTPGLITVFLITFLVLIPILMLGINALASIQSPVRVEPPKGYSELMKKTQ
ncbi:hypothetical protein BD779DRAFT_1560949 [Infundibulicybe gibba]|nr:hypothetical protein BD779DRAFT_1560949 [Infundibulicybe gibba]